MTEAKLLEKIYSSFMFKPVLKNYKNPVTGRKQMNVTQWFGENLAPYYKDRGMLGHGALDMRSTTGTESFSPIDGTVTKVKHDPTQNTRAGEYIRIRSRTFRADKTDWYLDILWYHIDRSLVAVGDIVKAAQRVCLTDNTGAYTTGPHLHFAVRPYKKIRGVFVQAFPNNGYRGYMDPFPFFRSRDFVKQPPKDRIAPESLIKSKSSAKVFYVNDHLDLLHIGNEEAFDLGRDFGFWGDWADIKTVGGKLDSKKTIEIYENIIT